MSIPIKPSSIVVWALLLTVITSGISCACTNPNKPQVKSENRKGSIVNEGIIKEVQSAAEKYLQEIPENEADWMQNEFNTLLEALKKVQNCIRSGNHLLFDCLCVMLACPNSSCN